MKVTFRIREGRITGIGELVEGLGRKIEERRISKVVPESTTKRFLFLLLRKLFGDRGKVASWTRRWKGRWLVVFEDGTVLGPFEDRREAIEKEIEELARRLKDEDFCVQECRFRDGV